MVLDGHPVDGVRLTVGRILVAACLVLMTNVVTFALLYWQVDGGGPARRVAEPPPFPDFQFPQPLPQGLAAYVFTDSLKRAHQTADALKTGIVWAELPQALGDRT